MHRFKCKHDYVGFQRSINRIRYTFILCNEKGKGVLIPLFKHFPIPVSLDKASIDERKKKSIVDS